jgi:hypothetical protein
MISAKEAKELSKKNLIDNNEFIANKQLYFLEERIDFHARSGNRQYTIYDKDSCIASIGTIVPKTIKSLKSLGYKVRRCWFKKGYKISW